ncbi:hypothetical protein TTHERM_00094260 (macronuclear) [Tetrahymena thermophila SB210]|uniref:Uncharacterized protein n=1 Tax=Tetrahymena thermophila (strain SB210) TaxID=312017 RepID=Q235W5_TETTS|nr:hypothetical protein TTHERM_00094260 [Tetrahymena thermophila SB210]EAR92635.2 hypothetical protein TTHERM_00094260 [Tetrahymena thermophila SB210]|eukprot:XP_001012880.2 hypothetical protein TTHERM_00094260 [Tetrahymena thermophila SB210]
MCNQTVTSAQNKQKLKNITQLSAAVKCFIKFVLKCTLIAKQSEEGFLQNVLIRSALQRFLKKILEKYLMIQISKNLSSFNLKITQTVQEIKLLGVLLQIANSHLFQMTIKLYQIALVVKKYIAWHVRYCTMKITLANNFKLQKINQYAQIKVKQR